MKDDNDLLEYINEYLDLYINQGIDKAEVYLKKIYLDLDIDERKRISLLAYDLLDIMRATYGDVLSKPPSGDFASAAAIRPPKHKLN